MWEDDHGEDPLTRTVIQSIIRVHQTLGPGFLESIYRRALVIDLQRAKLQVETAKEIVIYYDGEEVGRHRLDLLVEQRLIIEMKTVEDLSQAHYAQLRSYLRATGLPVGLLVNFSGAKADHRRVENPTKER